MLINATVVVVAAAASDSRSVKMNNILTLCHSQLEARSVYKHITGTHIDGSNEHEK